MSEGAAVIECSSLDEVRTAIDGLDQQIVQLLAARGAYVSQAARFKKDDDAVRAPQRVEQVIAKDWPNATVYVYEAGHGFNSDRRKDYHEPSADLAKQRTLDLFRANGG